MNWAIISFKGKQNDSKGNISLSNSEQDQNVQPAGKKHSWILGKRRTQRIKGRDIWKTEGHFWKSKGQFRE